MTAGDTQLSLMTRTIELLNADERALTTIFLETRIPFYWLRSFKANKFKDPSVNRVQALYEYLTGDALRIK